MSGPVDEGEVLVWEARPDAQAEPADRALALLSEAEREQHDRFVFERDRALYRVAHALVRDVLGRLLDADPRTLTFTTNEWGRPELTDRPLRFNLSHTHGLVALAVTGAADVGVDVEGVDRLQDPLALASSVFAPSEIAALTALPPSRQRERFFAYWTLKEAYIKARGMGLALPLDGFAFDVPEDAAPIGLSFAADFLDPGGGWWFERWEAGPVHRGAVAVRGPGPWRLRRAAWG